MAKPWYLMDIAAYEALSSEIEAKYPDLRCALENGKALVMGYYPVCGDGQVLDRYLIRLVLPPDSIRGLPVLYETSGRIARDAAHHMSEDGAACVVLPDAFWHDHPDGMTPVEFLDGPVRSYLASQSLVEKGEDGAWPSGEWGHGVDGIVEFYGSILGFTDISIVLAFLKVLAGDVVKGHWNCPCGSHKRIRDCHFALILDLRKRIPRQVAAKSAAILVTRR